MLWWATRSTRRLLRRAWPCVVLPLVLTGCPASELEDESQPDPAARTISARHRDARRAAWAWLDRLEVDPVALIERGVKGKKKLAEILTAYLSLLRYAPDPSEQPRIQARVRELAAQAERPEYHNMLRCDLKEFNENSKSYLRVAWLLEQLDLETQPYRARLVEAQQRFDRALSTRPRGQRARFAEYYDYFGWTRPAGLQESPAPGPVANRLPFPRYRVASGYALTHEVSSAFRYGLRRQQEVFDPGDLDYLSRMLPLLVRRFVAKADPDLVAELVSSMTYLELHELPAYRHGIEFLLDGQNADGSWGDHESHRAALADDVEPKLYLHTTMVVLRALLEARDGAWLETPSARAP